SNFDFLRYSAAESFSLRASMASLAMRDLFYPCCTILSRSAPLSPRVGARPGKGDSSSPAPAQRRRRTVSVAPRGKRHPPRGPRMRLLPRRLAQRDLLRTRHSRDVGEVRPAAPATRMHQLVRELAVVGDQQSAFDVVVEAAHRVDALGNALQVLRDGWAAFRIGERRHAPGGLVEHE